MTETAQGFAYQTAEDGGDLADTKGFPWDIDYAGSDSILSDDYYSTDAPSDDYGTGITMTGSPVSERRPLLTRALITH